MKKILFIIGFIFLLSCQDKEPTFCYECISMTGFYGDHKFIEQGYNDIKKEFCDYTESEMKEVIQTSKDKANSGRANFYFICKKL